MGEEEDAVDGTGTGRRAVGDGGVGEEVTGDVEPASSYDFFGRARRVGRVDARGKLYQVATADHPGDGRTGRFIAEDQVIVLHGSAPLDRTNLYL
jgi:hypothetical protein